MNAQTFDHQPHGRTTMTDEESDRYDLMHEWSIDQYFLSLEDPEFYETNHRHSNYQPNDSLDIIPDCLRRVRD